MTRLLHPLPEAQEVLGGLSRSALYEKIRDREIAVVKIGRRSFITHDELQRYVDTLTGSELQG